MFRSLLTVSVVAVATLLGAAPSAAMMAPSGAPAGKAVFRPTADAFVTAALPRTNFGTSATLRLDRSPLARAYVRFTVRGLRGAVARATLRVFSVTGSRRGYRVHSVPETFRERTITHANAPFPSRSNASSGSLRADSWTSVDVTPLVTGNGVVGLALTTRSPGAISLASREARARATRRLRGLASSTSRATSPQLLVETTADTRPPTAPRKLKKTGQTETTISASWNASRDDVGVAGYKVYADGREVGSTTTTSYTFSGLSCGTSYTLGVAAYDSAGNLSAETSLSASTSPCSATPGDTSPVPGDTSPVYLPPEGKAWFGSTDSTTLSNAELESSVLAGRRKVDIVHVYKRFDDYDGTKPFPGNTKSGVPIGHHVGNGKMIFIGYEPKIAGQWVSGGWAAIARGDYDRYIDAFADKLRAWSDANGGKEMFVSFHHEADGFPAGMGTWADFRAAFRHFHDRLVARGARNRAILVFNVVGYKSDVHKWNAMYPGDDVVDWLGYDPYGRVEHSSTTTSRTWHKAFGEDEQDAGPDDTGDYRFYAWAMGKCAVASADGKTYCKQHVTAVPAGGLSKPVMAAEVNSAYDPALDAANVQSWREFWNGGVQELGAGRYSHLRALVGFFSYTRQYDPRNDLGTGTVENPEPGSILDRFRALAALGRLNAPRPY